MNRRGKYIFHRTIYVFRSGKYIFPTLIYVFPSKKYVFQREIHINQRKNLSRPEPARTRRKENNPNRGFTVFGGYGRVNAAGALSYIELEFKPALSPPSLPFLMSSLRPSSPSPLSKRAHCLARLRRRERVSGSAGRALPGRRLTRPLGALVFFVLLALCVRAFVGQRFPLARQIERAARAQYIPQLEKQLGQKIEVGAFSTDWLGRVHVEDIVVGRNPRLPTGALLQAKSATLSLDIVALATGRAKFPDAISGVDLEAPQLFLRRDARGFNLASLFRSSSTTSATNRWSGRIGLHGARLVYLDEIIRSRANEALCLDTRGAEAEVAVRAPTRDTSAFEFTGNAAQTALIGTKTRTELGAFPLRGRIAAQGSQPARGWIETQTPALPAPLLASWVRSSPVAVEGGRIGGRVQVAFIGAHFAPRGDVVLEGGALRVPRAGAKPIEVSALSGPLVFEGTTFESAGLTARVADTNWRARGQGALGENGAPPTFEGDVSTNDLSLSGVRAALPNVLPVSLGARQIALSAHVNGTLAAINASGNLSAQSARWKDGSGRDANFPIIRATGALALNTGKPLQIAARFDAPDGALASPAPKIERATLRAASWSGTLRGANGSWNVDARVGAWQGSAARGGSSRGQSAHLIAQSGAGGVWNGGLDFQRASTSALRLGALFPSASLIERSGELSAQTRFSLAGNNLNRVRLQSHVFLSELALRDSAIPASARAQIASALGSAGEVSKWLSARNITGDVSLADGRLRLANASAQTLEGRLRGALQTPVPAFAPQFWIGAPDLQLPPSLLSRLARSRGIALSGDWGARGALRARSVSGVMALEAVLHLHANRFAAQGGARIIGRGAFLDVSGALNAARPQWSATGRFDALRTSGGALGTSGFVIPASLSGTRAAGVAIVATSLRNVGVSRPTRLEEGVSPAPAKLRGGADALFQSIGSAWTMNLSAARVAVPFGRAGARSIATLRDVSALASSQREGVNLPRVGFRWGTGARVDGALSFASDGLRGELLARSVEASALQNQLLPSAANLPRLSGRLNARARFSPAAPVRVEAQMARGQVTFVASNSARPVSLPIRALRLVGTANSDALSIESASGFVGGARVEAQGTAAIATGLTRARVRLAGLSLSPIAALAGVPTVSGLARGELHIAFDPNKSVLKASGPVHLDGAAWKGASLDAADAAMNAVWNIRSQAATLQLQHARGRLEGARWSGSLSLDTARNSWGADVAATDLSLLRAARVRARFQNALATGEELSRLTPPVEGVASAQISASGTLFDAKPRGKNPTSASVGGFSPRAVAGFARLSVPRFGYGAKTLGNLEGTFNLAGGRLSFAPLLLRPVANAGDDAATFANAPSLSLLGSVPIERGGGPLDARISIGEAPLDFFAQGVSQGQSALGAAGFASPFLNSAAAYVAALPPGLRGRVALEASLGGTWDAPILRVSSLTLRDGRAPLPLGGLSFPATLDAAFTLRGGEVTIERGQFRLAKTERDPSKTPVASATPPPDEPANAPKMEPTFFGAPFIAPKKVSVGSRALFIGTRPIKSGRKKVSVKPKKVSIGSRPIKTDFRPIKSGRVPIKSGRVPIKSGRLPRRCPPPHFENGIVGTWLAMSAASPSRVYPWGPTNKFAVWRPLAERPPSRTTHVCKAFQFLCVHEGGRSAKGRQTANLFVGRATERRNEVDIARLAMSGEPPIANVSRRTWQAMSLQLPAPAVLVAAAMPATVAPTSDSSNDTSAEDDTLVQVESGSKLSIDGQSDLNADVLNANLSQLAPWVPALRDANGATLLKGQLEGFSFRVRGPLSDPRVTGSVDAQNIEFGAHDIERLRVSRFDIGGGFASIEPGNLSIKEERFESSAASGRVAWDWKRLGPVPDGPLQLRFPLATRDFGALAALLLPQLQGVRADDFSGLVEVGGTVSTPRFDGQIALKNAAFRLASSLRAPLALAVKNLSGALKFGEGNRLVIDPENPISGELVAPDAPVSPPKNSARAKAKSASARTIAASATPPATPSAFGARGAFGMRGSVSIAPTGLSQLLSDPAGSLAGNAYDLRLDLNKGELDALPTSGARDIAACAMLRTADPQDAANSQTLRWMVAARGARLNKKIGAGELLSRGALRLRSDFALGIPSLARSTPLAFDFPSPSAETGDGRDSDAAKRLKESDFSGARPQLLLHAFAARATGYGEGVADGRLFLDKGAVRAPDSPAARVQVASLAKQLSTKPLFGTWSDAEVSPLRSHSAKAELDWAAPLPVADESNNDSDVPLRLAGDLSVSDAQIVGGGAGGDGQVTRLSFLPDAPRLDVRLALGRGVELVNSSLRARLVGDLNLSGVPSDPLLLGTVSLLDGQVRFPNARARVEEGTVQINVSRDDDTDLPRVRLDVDALARGQSGQYTVTLRLHGPLRFDATDQNKSNLQIDVTSNPPLSQDEAFAQLLGISPRDFSNRNGGVNVGAANQAYAQAVLQLVAAPFFSGFERSVAQALGLTNVSFEYRFNEPLAFEVSKALGDRVAISYRRSLGATAISAGRTPYRLRIDYRIEGDYFLGLQTDERNIRAITLQKSFRF